MRSVRARLLALAAGLVVVLLIGVFAATRGSASPGYTLDDVRINGTRETDDVPFILVGDLYLPDVSGPAPAILLAHGYGGSKDSVAAQAKQLAGRGFVVLTYSARGFGGSGGKVHLDSPTFEVKDAQLMLDYLAQRPEVLQDGTGDPRVGVAGESYGGALALLLAGVDHRVDAVVPSITWNNLAQALFPQFATSGSQTSPATLDPIANPGVFKKQWTALLLGASAASAAPADGTEPAATAPPGSSAGATASGSPTPSTAASASASASSSTSVTPSASGAAAPSAGASATPADPRTAGLQTLAAACGRLDPQVCFGYIQAAQSGRPSSALLELLDESSPSTVDAKITAPTLLLQGEDDSLFPLSEADANARAIAAAGTPVQVAWYSGGHDGSGNETGRFEALTASFMTRVLHQIPGSAAAKAASATSSSQEWQVSVPDAAISSVDTNPIVQRRSASSYPGLAGTRRQAPLSLTAYPLSGGEQLAISPPGATPAALTSLPGAGSALSLLSSAGGGSSGLGLNQVAGQSASFETAPLPAPITITGSSRVAVRVTSTATDATLFASLVDVGPDGRTTLPEQLVSPVRLDKLSAAGRRITVALPAIVHDVPAGHRLRVVFASTDQAYALPSDARGYRISLVRPVLSVPEVPLTTQNDGATKNLLRPALLLALGILALILLFVVRGRRARRRTRTGADPDLLDVPLAVQHLGKAYGDGFRAVTDVSFRVETGQVLGLLGPNGAGKTTTLRMLMGLIHPTEGEIRVFGHRITPGAAVLSRVGSFVEGPGFLPHLSGMDNLQLYWRATGRPLEDSYLEMALDIAGLGDDVHRKVRTYSQGMRQRLAIAQSMLGLPDLLVLDEPTNGLDPPQIRQMRAVLRRYAETGRTVIVSSHLLAEVEQTCTHLVVMADGTLVAQGTTENLVGASTLTAMDVSTPARAASLAAVVDGVSGIETTLTGITVHADADARGELVRTLVLAGVRVDRVAPQRGLEETFLALVGREDS